MCYTGRRLLAGDAAQGTPSERITKHKIRNTICYRYWRYSFSFATLLVVSNIECNPCMRVMTTSGLFAATHGLQVKVPI